MSIFVSVSKTEHKTAVYSLETRECTWLSGLAFSLVVRQRKIICMLAFDCAVFSLGFPAVGWRAVGR
jgi:hypothetical protein